MELALRLLANEELDPQDVKNVQDDINYFVESNQDPDFVEDETIYDGLNLQSNEAIAHEVAQYFASQNAEDNNTSDANESLQDISKLSKRSKENWKEKPKRLLSLRQKMQQVQLYPLLVPLLRRHLSFPLLMLQKKRKEVLHLPLSIMQQSLKRLLKLL